MKIVFVLISSLCVTYAYGQQLDLSRLEFFPLHKGDTWQYGFYQNPIPSPILSAPFFVSVIDTLLPNGLPYAGLSFLSTPTKVFKFLRVDSLLRVQEYTPGLGDSCGGASNELNTYRLGEKDSTVWSVCTNMGQVYFPKKTLVRFNGITPDSIFMRFQVGNPNIPEDGPRWSFQPLTLMRGVGVWETDNGDGRVTYFSGAIINGKQIGNPIMHIRLNEERPRVYSLECNYPNPFNPFTTITYSIPQESHVVMKIFNPIGQEFTTLVDELKPAGSYVVVWNGSSKPSGVYFYQMQAGTFSQTNKMILTK